MSKNENRLIQIFNVGAELRLCTIFGFAQLMQSSSPALNAMQQRSVDKILKAGWYLLDLISKIPDFVQVDSGKLLLALEAVSLVELMGGVLVSNVLLLFTIMLEKKELI